MPATNCNHVSCQEFGEKLLIVIVDHIVDAIQEKIRVANIERNIAAMKAGVYHFVKTNECRPWLTPNREPAGHHLFSMIALLFDIKGEVVQHFK